MVEGGSAEEVVGIENGKNKFPNGSAENVTFCSWEMSADKEVLLISSGPLIDRDKCFLS